MKRSFFSLALTFALFHTCLELCKASCLHICDSGLNCRAMIDNSVSVRWKMDIFLKILRCCCVNNSGMFLFQIIIRTGLYDCIWPSKYFYFLLCYYSPFLVPYAFMFMILFCISAAIAPPWRARRFKEIRDVIALAVIGSTPLYLQCAYFHTLPDISTCTCLTSSCAHATTKTNANKNTCTTT